MVSGYLDKFTPPFEDVSVTELRMEIVEEMRGITDKAMLKNLYPSFDEFARWLIKHGNMDIDHHFKAQIAILCIPEVKYDYIVPLEYASLLNDEIGHVIGPYLRGSYDGTTNPRALDQVSAEELGICFQIWMRIP